MQDKSFQSRKQPHAFEANLESENRKWKTLVISSVIIVILGVSYAFFTTFSQIGSLNADIKGVFSEVDDKNFRRTKDTSKTEKQTDVAVIKAPPLDPVFGE